VPTGAGQRARGLTTSTGCRPMTEADPRIAQTFQPRDWAPLRDAVLQVISLVGEDRGLGLALINRYLRSGLLELALVAPDGTMTRFPKTDCEQRTVHAPHHPAEGVRVEPYEAGRYFVGRAGLAKLTSLAPRATAADRQLPPPAPKKRSRKKTTHGGTQTRRATAVLNRIFPEGRYPDEDEMAWPDVWIMFCEEHARYAKENPSEYKCPSPSTVRRVLGRGE
jgi:hypothetical protein